MEWLGPTNVNFPNVSRESDADQGNDQCGGMGMGSDEDGRPNLDPEDTDSFDDGVTITACGQSGPFFGIDVTVTSSISTRGGVPDKFIANNVGYPEDPADSLPRYDPLNPTRRLYLAAWADWNGDGVWAAGEKIIDIPVDPTSFGANGQYTLGEPFDDNNRNGVFDTGDGFPAQYDLFGVDSHTFHFDIDPPGMPQDLPDDVWFRFRLSYGEDETTVDLQVKESDAANRMFAQEQGSALFGEVEDYKYSLAQYDRCDAPRVVNEGQFDFDTRAARYDGYSGACGGQGPDIWFRYTPTCTGRAFISTCNNTTNFDTVIDVWNGAACPPVGQPQDCNDDDENCLNENYKSSLVTNVIAGQSYLIRVSGFAGACGVGRLDIRCKASGEKLYVNQAVAGGNGSGDSWANAIPRLEVALQRAALSYGEDNMLNVKEIWVAQGFYFPSQNGGLPGSRSATFALVSGVKVYGGFNGTEAMLNQRNINANLTVLSGDLLGNDAGFANRGDNCYHVVTAQSCNTTTLLDGFTIEGGNADGPEIAQQNGGNVYIFAGDRPRFINLTIEGGSANNSGGGIYIYQGAPTIARCQIRGNRTLGNRGGPTPCNLCGGGGVYSDAASPTITNCRIYQNTAVTAFGGGVHFQGGGTGVMVNCYLYENTAVSGAGVCTELSPASVRNCTLTMNAATDVGGAFLILGCGNVIANTISWNNMAVPGGGPEFAIGGCGNGCGAMNPTIDNCCVQGGFAAILIAPGCGVNYNAANNIMANPLLAGNGSIANNSPCINAGNNAFIPAEDPADLNNNNVTAEAVPLDLGDGPRIRNNIVDIGAYEVPMAPPNNGCPNAVPINPGRTNFDTSGATTDGPAACGTMTNDIWFCHTATCNGILTVSTCGSSFDTVIAAYNGCGCPNLVQAACNDNCCGLQSVMSFPVVIGNTYLIQVGGALGAAGAGVLTIACQPNAAIRFVDQAALGANTGTSWLDAFTDLQSALQAAACTPGVPQEIWVADGTYRPAGLGGSRSASFAMRSGVAIYGGFAGGETMRSQRNPAGNVTVLSGDLNGDDGTNFANNAENVYHVVTATNTDATAVLDGFTITGGNADAAAPNDRGGGLLLTSSSATIGGCVVTANSTVYGGGGLYASGGGIPTMSRSNFTNNRATSNCGNCGGGGIYFETQTPGRLVSCRVQGNSGQNGGGVFYRDDCDGSIINCDVAANAGAGGGGLCIALNSETQVLDCTVRSNTASVFGGGCFIFRCNPTFRNCIFWGDTAPAGPEFSLPFCPASATISHSTVQGGQAAMQINGGCSVNYGPGNLEVNPQLQPDGSLAPASPAHNVGSNAFLPADFADVDNDGNTAEALPLDLAGGQRVLQTTVDMGAFESNGSGGTGDCDPNCDGVINNFDIDPFVLALSNPSAYMLQYPACNFVAANDCNQDGMVNNFDIDSFIVCLVSGGCP